MGPAPLSSSKHGLRRGTKCQNDLLDFHFAPHNIRPLSLWQARAQAQMRGPPERILPCDSFGSHEIVNGPGWLPSTLPKKPGPLDVEQSRLLFEWAACIRGN